MERLTPCPPPSILLFSSEVNYFFFFAIFAGNGYIEGKELENFFQELEKARKGSGMVSLDLSPNYLGFSVILTITLSIVYPRLYNPSVGLTSPVLTLGFSFICKDF